MVLSKLPGIYFSETVEATNTENIIRPLYLVQTKNVIDSLDNKITLFNSIDDFKTAVEGKGLTYTTDFIEKAINETNNTITSFYVYSIKTDTITGFTNALINTTNYANIKNVFYIEEETSSSSNTLTNKITAMQTGVQNNATNGVNRIVYTVPYATLNDAVSNEKDATKEETALTTMTEVTKGFNNGRTCIIFPDTQAGIIAGKIIRTPYNEDIGFSELNTGIIALDYAFNYTQMVTLMNAGVIFINQEVRRGGNIYRVNLGVTTSFSSENNKADSLLLSRTIADEVLDQINERCEPFVKDTETENTINLIQAECDRIVEEYIETNDVLQEGTELTVRDTTKPYTIEITGYIKPVGCIAVIEVNTTLKQEVTVGSA